MDARRGRVSIDTAEYLICWAGIAYSAGTMAVALTLAYLNQKGTAS